MSKPPHRVQHIAITFADQSVGIMSFVLDPNLDPGAKMPGWDGKQREATDAAIQHEVDKSSWLSQPVSWRRIEPHEVPTDRSRRNEWRDHGTHIGPAK